MIWKFQKQNVIFPKGLNWVQHSYYFHLYRIGNVIFVSRLEWTIQNEKQSWPAVHKTPAENIAWSRKTIIIAQSSLAQMQLFKKIQMEK